MLDQLRPNYAVKFCFRWNLLNASDKYFGARRARDLRTLEREIGPDTTSEERACLIKKVTIAATDLQKIATSQAAFGEVSQKVFECCSEREFLGSVAGIGVSASSKLFTCDTCGESAFMRRPQCRWTVSPICAKGVAIKRRLSRLPQPTDSDLRVFIGNEY